MKKWGGERKAKMMIEIKNNICDVLYDMIDHCRTDTLENFVEDLLYHLNAEAGTNDKDE